MTKAQQEHRVTGAQAIDRALSLLDCFVETRTELGISQLSTMVGLSPSTVHRIVRALVHRGVLEQNGQTDRYRLGRRTVLLGEVAQQTFAVDWARPILAEIGRKTGESVNLVVRDNGAGIIIMRIESKQALRFEQQLGARIPLHASASGKALLAFSDDLERALGELPALERYTGRTLTDITALKKDLQAVRARGFSFDYEESLLGVRCVGVPVLDSSDVARAAIAVQGPAVRLSKERMHELGSYLLGKTLALSDLAPRGSAGAGHG